MIFKKKQQKGNQKDPNTHFKGCTNHLLDHTELMKLGLPALPDHSFAAVSEGMQHTLYKGMIAPLALLGGLVFLARRGVKSHDDEDPSS